MTGSFSFNATKDVAYLSTNSSIGSSASMIIVNAILPLTTELPVMLKPLIPADSVS